MVPLAASSLYNPTEFFVGDVVYLDVAGQPIIYLNTCETALELFEKRSALYSDRPQSSMMQL
jgi:hypothetical protein